MAKKLKQVPKFESDAEEREFWATHDTADYIDWSGARRAVFPDLLEEVPPQRVPGRGQGRWSVAEDFDAPLPDDVQRGFEGDDA